MVPAGAGEAEAAEAVNELIEKRLLPAVNTLGDYGWDLVMGARRMESLAREAGDRVTALVGSRLAEIIEQVEMAHGLERGSDAFCVPDFADIAPEMIETLEAAKAADRAFFRAQPKGMGVVCLRKDGIPRGTFVAEWAGEVYSPWRWFEKQDAFKKKNPNAALPDFYNIMLERPKDDSMVSQTSATAADAFLCWTRGLMPQGYDVLFVDSSARGNFTSRMSHSCTPNCCTMPMAAEGRATIAFVATRDIICGEEMTWDYASVTESEKEFRAAICMCGTRHCRGSFLYYSNSRSFQEVTSRDHKFLDRNALLVRAVMEGIGGQDTEALDALGIKSSAFVAEFGLGETEDMVDPARLPPAIRRSAYIRQKEPGQLPAVRSLVPDWLRKWAALICRFIEHEHNELPAALVRGSRLAFGVPLDAPDEAVLQQMSSQGQRQELRLSLGDPEAELALRFGAEEENGEGADAVTDPDHLAMELDADALADVSPLDEASPRACTPSNCRAAGRLTGPPLFLRTTRRSQRCSRTKRWAGMTTMSSAWPWPPRRMRWRRRMRRDPSLIRRPLTRAVTRSDQLAAGDEDGAEAGAEDGEGAGAVAVARVGLQGEAMRRVPTSNRGPPERLCTRTPIHWPRPQTRHSAFARAASRTW